MNWPKSLALAALIIVASACSKSQPSKPEGTTAQPTSSQATSGSPSTTESVTKAAPSASAPAERPAKGPCADQGLVAVRVLGQASHAKAKSDMRLNLKTRRLKGTGYEIPNAGKREPRPTKVSVKASEADVKKLQDFLKTLCLPVQVAERPQHSAPGGYTRWELIYADKTVVAAYGSPIEAGEKYIQLTVEQFRALGEAWPQAR